MTRHIITDKLQAIARFYLRAWVALPWIIFGMVVEGLCFFAMIAGHPAVAKL